MKGGHTVFMKKYFLMTAGAAIRLALAVTSAPMRNACDYYAPLDTYLSYPALVGRSGIIEQLQLSLTEEEEAN